MLCEIKSRWTGKKFIPFFLLLFLFSTSCSDKEPTAPEESTPAEVLAEKNIGPGGGIVETNEFVLNVPEGAFLTNSEIKLYEEKENPSGENSCSKLFRVEGIPDNYQKPLKVSIKYSGTLSGESAVAIGNNTYDYYSDSTFVIYDIYSATDSNGTLNCEIPPSSSASNIYKSNNTRGSDVAIWVDAWTRGSKYSSSHFRYIEYSKHLTETQKFALRDFLEELYTKYENWGFDYSKRSWPIRVDITNDNNFKGSIENPDKDSYLKFSIPSGFDISNKNWEIEQMFNLLIGIMYWPADLSPNEKPDFYWLNRAFMLWSTIQFYTYWNEVGITNTNFQNYVSKSFNGFENYNAHISHGKAMTLMVEYLINNIEPKGAEKISKIYDKIGKGTHHIQAIFDIAGSTLDWLHVYHRYIIENGIFKNMLGDFWINNCEEEMTIDNTFTSKKITDKFFDLSGKWYKINIDSNVPSGKNLIIESGADNFFHVHISIFSFQGNDLEFLGDAESAVEIEDVKSYADAGKGLIALISNGLTTPPFYKGTIDITTDFKFGDTKIPEFSNCEFELKIKRTIHHVYNWKPDEVITDTVIFGDIVLREHPFTNVLIGKNTFTGTWEYEGLPNSALNLYATVYAEFSEDRSKINRLEIKKEVTPKDNSREDKQEYEIIITDIPLLYSNYYYYLKPEDNPCTHIQIFTESTQSDWGSGDIRGHEMISWDCVDDSYIKIPFK